MSALVHVLYTCTLYYVHVHVHVYMYMPKCHVHVHVGKVWYSVHVQYTVCTMHNIIILYYIPGPILVHVSCTLYI